jgi:hypothetical protein
VCLYDNNCEGKCPRKQIEDKISHTQQPPIFIL